MSQDFRETLAASPGLHINWSPSPSLVGMTGSERKWQTVRMTDNRKCQRDLRGLRISIVQGTGRVPGIWTERSFSDNY